MTTKNHILSLWLSAKTVTKSLRSTKTDHLELENQKDGQDFVRDTLQIEISTKHFKELAEKKADPSYQVAQSIKKSSIVEIETLINKSLDHTGYTNLSLDKPEIDRYVIVPFTILESKIERSEWDSKHDLQKLLIKTLEPTNWRLMSAGISYR